MVNSLEQILSKLAADQILSNSLEEAIKQGVILPILFQLGWDCFNIQEVVPEFSVGPGRVDYCLQIRNKEAVFIEAKRTLEDLENHEKQLLEYSFEYGVDIAILTNGMLWWFYLPLVEGNWRQRKFFTIDIQQQDPHTASLHFNEFLSKNAVMSGSAIKKAKEVRESRERAKQINITIPKAWDQLLGEPDEFLVELLSDKVESICGYKPEINNIADFIQLIYKNEAQLSTGKAQGIKTHSQRQKKIDDKRLSKPIKQKENRRRGVIVTVGNKKIQAPTVGDLYYQVLKYICDNNFINKLESEIPWATSKVRLLIAKEAKHQRGNPFRIPIEYNGYFMEAHKSYKEALNHLEPFLKICGLDLKKY